MRRYRPFTVLLLSIGVSALVGGAFGRRALALDDNIAEQQKAFVAALRAIETNYVDEVPSDRLVYSAIRGMLGTLDPHSSFFDPKEYAQMRERQEGRYYGLGITIAQIDDNIVAQSVFEGSPAYKMGVRRGDIIARISGEDAKGWTTEQAMVKLRGPKGTNVKIEIKRRGYEEPIPLEVTRDEVHILTVPSYFMVDATTGYIHMKDFGENTDREVKAALRDLTKQGMKRLLFDARQNPGGPLDQAIKVANSFLPKGKMVVYTRGRISNSDQDYRAADDGEFQNIPVVMLVNRNSASASEIVTGALQDHDRALHRRRDDVRQGARAVGLPDRQRRRARADDGALLHAVGPADSAALGFVVRRVPELRHARAGREQAAQRQRSEADVSGPAGVQRRRGRARSAHLPGSTRASTRRPSAAC